MLAYLVLLLAVSICLLLHKVTNDFTRPLGNNSVFIKSHLEILSRQIPHEATDDHYRKDTQQNRHGKYYRQIRFSSNA